MFKINSDAMRMEATPERVYAICCLVAHKSSSKEQIIDYISLGEGTDKSKGDIGLALSVAAEELGVIVNRDGVYSLNVSPSVLNSMSTFRQYVTNRVFVQKTSTFTQFTYWYLAKNESIFNMRTWEDKAVEARTSASELASINENAVLGWRFWAAFLGLGYLSGTTLIPNMKLRIQDAISINWAKVYSCDELVSVQDFLIWVKKYMPEVEIDGLQSLSLGFSAGLRTLHELGLIELKAQRDAQRIQLYHVDADPHSDFSHIIVKEAIVQ